MFTLVLYFFRSALHSAQAYLPDFCTRPSALERKRSCKLTTLSSIALWKSQLS